MKNRSLWIYGIMIVTLAGMSVFLVQGTAQAVVNCSTNMSTTTDSDGDGFTDYQECNWNAQLTLIDTTIKIYGKSNCPQTCPSGTTCHCLDPDKKDLFVIIDKPTTGSLLPPDPLQYVSAAISAGGLGIVLHPIYKNSVQNRAVYAVGKQNAIKLIESLDTGTGTGGNSNDTLGFANTGTPMQLDNTTVYTARIKNFIQTTCGAAAIGTPRCTDSTGVTGDALVTKYILHTIAHEAGHTLGPLAATYNANYGGYHYDPNAHVIMDQSIYFTQSTSGGNKTTTFYIGAAFTGADQTAAKLK